MRKDPWRDEACRHGALLIVQVWTDVSKFQLYLLIGSKSAYYRMAVAKVHHSDTAARWSGEGGQNYQ